MNILRGNVLAIGFAMRNIARAQDLRTHREFNNCDGSVELLLRKNVVIHEDYPRFSEMFAVISVHGSGKIDGCLSVGGMVREDRVFDGADEAVKVLKQWFGQESERPKFEVSK